MVALTQELSRTISETNGIHSARVQVMIPVTGKFARTEPAASVAFLVEPGVDVTPLVPSIKSPVSHSIPDLAYERMTVAPFPVDAPSIEPLPVADLLDALRAGLANSRPELRATALYPLQGRGLRSAMLPNPRLTDRRNERLASQKGWRLPAVIQPFSEAENVIHLLGCGPQNPWPGIGLAWHGNSLSHLLMRGGATALKELDPTLMRRALALLQAEAPTGQAMPSQRGAACLVAAMVLAAPVIQLATRSAPTTRRILAEAAQTATPAAATDFQQDLAEQLTRLSLAQHLTLRIEDANAAVIQGRVPASRWQAWRSCAEGFDLQPRAPVLVQSVSRSDELTSLKPVATVRLAEPAPIHLADAETRAIGDALQAGWAIDSLDESGMVLKRGDDLTEITC